MNGQEHAWAAENLLTDHTAEAQVHATLAVAYAQAGAWADVPSPETLVVHPLHPDDPRNKVTTHVRESTDHGPDFCKPCSDAIGEWVPWPCAGSLTSGPCGEFKPAFEYLGHCVRARGHDDKHVTAGGVAWAD